jgi:UDP-N-acetylglucosamine 2-epimerase (non-hydrolysing)
MPEEKNRKIIDHISDYLLPYTNISKNNLITEGISENNIFVFGNPITDVLKTNEAQIDNSNIMKILNIRKNEYLLATIHRCENTDNLNILKNILNGLNMVAEYFDLPII